MKKIVFTLMTLVFFIQFNQNVQADECIPDNKPTLSGIHDFYYVIGEEKPDYLENITALDSCGNPFYSFIYHDSEVDYNEEGEYLIYYYARETYETATIFVYEDIPKIEGTKDLYVEIHSNPPNYLVDVSAYDVYNGNDLTDMIDVDSSDIDISKIGEYELIYSVKDHLNNVTEKTVTVYVQDTINPVIMNHKDLTLEVNTDITDYDFWQGISVSDNSQQSITTTLNLDNLIINTVGEYEVEYIAIDQSNNECREKVNVNVVDTKKPEIKNLEDLRILIGTTIDRSLLVQGIVVEDNYDGIIPNNQLIIDDRLVNSSKPGKYNVYYYVSDSSGNFTSKFISVTVYDEDIPEIIGAKDIRVSVFTESVNYLEGISCIDETEGDLTDYIKVEDQLVDLNRVGTYPLTYIIFDTSMNENIVNVKVIVYDEEIPIISGVTDLTIEVNTNLTKENILEGITAFDQHDGDITHLIDVDMSGINFNELGTYNIRFFVTDSSHNSDEKQATVTVVDTTSPVISGYKDMIVKLNETVDKTTLLQDISIIDNYDGDITHLANISDTYDTSKEGTYTITITVTDSNENESQASFDLLVVKEVVEEPPVEEEDDDELEDTNNNKNYSIFYIIGGISISLVVTGFLGYKSRYK